MNRDSVQQARMNLSDSGDEEFRGDVKNTEQVSDGGRVVAMRTRPAPGVQI